MSSAAARFILASDVHAIRSYEAKSSVKDSMAMSPVPMDESLSDELDFLDFDLEEGSEGKIDLSELLDADTDDHQQEELPTIISSAELSSDDQPEKQSQDCSGLTKNRTSSKYVLAHGPSRRSRKKKVKGMPKRPLSAYNIFFQQERPNVLKDFRVGFEGLGKLIGQRWKALSEQEREKFDELSKKEIARYHREMAVFEGKRRRRVSASGDLDQLSQDRLSTEWQDSPQGVASRSMAYPAISPGAPPRPTYVRTPFQVVAGDSTSSPPSSYTCVGASHPATSSQPPPFYAPVYPPCPSSDVRMVPANFPLMPVPQGMEVILPDAQGHAQRYKVTYKCYCMARSEADDYMTRLFSSSLSPKPPPDAASA